MSERWFDDLESQFAVASAHDARSYVQDLVAAELTTVTLEDRLRAVGEHVVTVMRSDGGRVTGRVRDVSREWVEISAEGEEWRAVIPLEHVAWVHGPLLRVRPLEDSDARRSLGWRLERCAENRQRVSVLVAGGSVEGLVRAVWKDHVDLATRAVGHGVSEATAGRGTLGMVAVRFAHIIEVRY